MKRRAALGMVLATALLGPLVGCGFQLRGSANFAFKRLYIQASGNSSLARELQRSVRQSTDTQVVEIAKEADAVFEILTESREKQVLTLNADGQVREYKLISRLIYKVHDNKGHDLIEPSEIALTRDFAFSEATALANDYSEQRLYKNMQTDIVQQVMRRMSAVKAL